MNCISKLPKWAQAHIETLQRERDHAEQMLAEHIDQQTESHFYTDEWDGTLHTRRYWNPGGHQMIIEANGIRAAVVVGLDDGIKVYFDKTEGAGGVGIFPQSSNVVELRAVNTNRKEN